MMLEKSSLLSFFITAVICAGAGENEFVAPPVTGHVHASTLLGTSGGYLAAWFEGSREGAGDVAIVGANRRGGVWSPKRTLAKVNDGASQYNPVLRRGADGRIVLYFKVGRNCADWRTYYRESRDDGETWGDVRELVPGDVSGGRGPVRNKCLRLRSGRLVAGASREFDPDKATYAPLWRAFADLSDDDGRTWRMTPPFRIPAAARSLGVIQPTLWEDARGVHALLRANDGWIWRTDSTDDGETWRELYRSSLENINSGIDCVKASDGRVYLVLNGANRDRKANSWGARNHLEIKVSGDGGTTWGDFLVLAEGAATKQPDGRPTEFSYPAIIEARPGVLAVTFTCNRRQICFREIALASVAEAPAKRAGPTLPTVVEPVVTNRLAVPPLGDVHLSGFVGRKLDDLIEKRMKSAFARREILGEAHRAFVERSDDRQWGCGLWRGEFWGKLMLGATRAARYQGDADFAAFLGDEARALARLQDADGYLCTYSDPAFIEMSGRGRADWCEIGWPSNWNLWCRKYTLWGMLAAAELAGDRALLDSAARQMDHWIAQLHRRGLSLLETGNPMINGLASMSVLKPLMALYAHTGKAAYLDYAREIVADWDRDDGRAPNLVRNALSLRPVHEWYPNPRVWAKGYEMMSCVDGLADYARYTGDARVLDAVRKLTDLLAEHESNVMGGVGYNAMFIGAAHQLSAMSEICDTVHWIKLNKTLFLLTGESRYADAVERAFYNELLAGAYRGGEWGAAAVRDQVRNMTHDCQVGMRHNHCCVDNLPRAFFDFAECALTRERDGAVQLNFYSDLTAALGGVRVTVTGNYPFGEVVKVAVENPARVPLRFRRPGWCRDWQVAGEGTDSVTIRFAMPPVLHRRDLPEIKAWLPPMTDPRRLRYVVPWKVEGNEDVIDRMLMKPRAYLTRGPLLLAKSVRVGDGRDEILSKRTVNEPEWEVALEPSASGDVNGSWKAHFSRGGERFTVGVCDYASAADTWYRYYDDAFSVWF